MGVQGELRMVKLGIVSDYTHALAISLDHEKGWSTPLSGLVTRDGNLAEK